MINNIVATRCDGNGNSNPRLVLHCEWYMGIVTTVIVEMVSRTCMYNVGSLLRQRHSAYVQMAVAGDVAEAVSATPVSSASDEPGSDVPFAATRFHFGSHGKARNSGSICLGRAGFKRPLRCENVLND